MLAVAVQNHIAVTGHGMGLGGSYPLPGQPQGLILLEAGARQQVDDEGALEALGQGLIEGDLEQQQRVAVLAEQVQQHQIVALTTLEQEVECIGLVQPRSPQGRWLKELLEQGEDLGVQIHTIVPCLGPACGQMAGEIPAAETELQDLVRLRGQPFGDALLMG